MQLTVPPWVRGRVVSLYLMAITGAVPVGALVSGVLAGAVGLPLAIGMLSLAVFAVAGVTQALRLPAIGEVDMPLAPDDWQVAAHLPSVPGGPVLVLITWAVEPHNVEEFLEAMRSVRGCRFRSGAVRWNLFIDPDQPGQLTELFEVPDWEEHLRQHGRLDRQAVVAIRRARELERNGMPSVRHLVGLEANAVSMPQLVSMPHLTGEAH
jgi:quinol monooxygenase YgiN